MKKAWWQRQEMVERMDRNATAAMATTIHDFPTLDENLVAYKAYRHANAMERAREENLAALDLDSLSSADRFRQAIPYEVESGAGVLKRAVQSDEREVLRDVPEKDTDVESDALAASGGA